MSYKGRRPTNRRFYPPPVTETTAHKKGSNTLLRSATFDFEVEWITYLFIAFCSSFTSGYEQTNTNRASMETKGFILHPLNTVSHRFDIILVFLEETTITRFIFQDQEAGNKYTFTEMVLFYNL